MRPPDRDDRRGLYRGAAWSVLALLAGLLLAWWLLPEWRTAFPLDEDTARQRYQELAARAGLSPAPGEPRVSALRGPYLRAAYRTQGETGDEWLAATQTAVLLEVSHRVGQPQGEARRFEARFSPRGEPQYLCWGGQGDRSDESARFAAMARLLLQPGESLGPPRGTPERTPWSASP